MAYAVLMTLALISSIRLNFANAYSGKLLLISMDGFRWDYPSKANTPNFTAFASMGVKAPYINNTFITKTFPCHYTIVTGLYEESHGIINNHMYDPDSKKIFSIRSTESFWWNAGEPIWITAKRQGKKTATYFWPGSEVELQGMRPDRWLNYSDAVPFLSRVDTVVDWFVNQSIDVATLYFPEPDHTGHTFGPDSREIAKKVEYMDSVLGYLMQKFDDNGLWNTVNVILTSDHGMTAIDVRNKVIDLTNYVRPESIPRVPGKGPTANILPLEGMLDEVFQNLTSAHPNMTVYKRNDIPDFWHYKHNKRILPIMAVADEGWYITMNATKLGRSYDTFKGTHGYDNRLMSMKPIFYARGPDFKSNYKGEVFRSVDIYPLMCELLGITPAPNNGSLLYTAGYRKAKQSSGTEHPIYSIFGLLVLLLFQPFLR